MNKLILCLCFAFVAITASAQKIYFVYLQTESQQPFFVKFNGKLHSSTASGYLILPRLKDSSYSFNIGFPQNKWPEQSFSVTVNKRDLGFLLKNFGVKGWGLVDMQTSDIQMASNGKSAFEDKPIPTGTDVSPFTEILAKVTDDPGLREKPIRPKPEEVKAVVVVQEPVKTEETKTETKDPVVSKSVETAEVTIAKKEEPKAESKEPVVSKPVETAEITIVIKEEPKTENKEPIVNKLVETAETIIAKKEEPKTEIKEPVINKPVETVETAVVKSEQAVEKTAERTDQAVTKKQEPNVEPAPVKPVEISDPGIDQKDESIVKVEETPETKHPQGKYKRSKVTRSVVKESAEGQDLVFIDNYNGKLDTIRLLIPNPKPIIDQVTDQSKPEKKFLEINDDASGKAENEADLATKEIIPAPGKSKSVKEMKEEVKTSLPDTTPEQPVISHCREMAAESDFLRLRKKMAASEDYDEMLSEARKGLRSKCFTVYQLRNLSTLFLTDEAKYKFFDESYTHVSDAHNFISLQMELKDEYYINRFKAMLK